ncbi:hypothetical protein AGMMS50276_10060 [Synergistales bacterium]|nr:hypothetical protein AGMMS50276_10060 [Synergistales bacterium]
MSLNSDICCANDNIDGELDDIADIKDCTLKALVKLYRWPKVIAVTGALGSGKTEFVLNLARGLKASDKSVSIADADIINPYFCIRQITEALEKEGFSVLNPPENAKWSDMSIINHKIGEAVVGKSDNVLLDIGGDAGGVMALKQFEPLIHEWGYELILVVNAFRPKTSTPEGIFEMATRMEALSDLKVTALISNSHLMEDTRSGDIAQGLETVLLAGKNMNLPVLYATVMPKFYAQLKKLTGDKVPLWPMTRFMKRPWEGSEMWS